MKAPYEWWMSDYGDGDWHQSDDGGIRYLRADLTCGECAKQDGALAWQGKECAHMVTSSYRTDLGSKIEDEHYQDDNAPACVAFEAKP